MYMNWAVCCKLFNLVIKLIIYMCVVPVLKMSFEGNVRLNFKSAV